MTVTANTTRNQYRAGNQQNTYAYTFQIHDASDLKVYIGDELKSLNTHYTVTGVGSGTGGNVVFDLGVDGNGDPIYIPENTVVSIFLAMDLDRDTNYQPSGAFLAADVNNDFDRLWIASNQQQTDINRSVRLQDTDADASMVLPKIADRADKLLGFSSVLSGATPVTINNNYAQWNSAYDNMITGMQLPSSGILRLSQQDGSDYTVDLDSRYHNIGIDIPDADISESSVTQHRTAMLDIPNNVKAKFGNGDELQIYSDGYTSVIKESGNGNLAILGDFLFLGNPDGTKNYFTAQDGTGVGLYHNGTLKISTSASGITVSGTIQATGYNDTNWNTAYNDKINAVSFSSLDNTLTLTQQDGSTLTTIINGSLTGGGETLAQTLAIGNTTGGNDISFGDNDKAKFGASDDLQIYHTGTNSILKSLTGEFLLQGNGITLRGHTPTETMLTADVNGAVTLHYDSLAKLATTSTGIDVTGTVTADGLSLAAGSTISSAGGLILTLDDDNSSSSTYFEINANGNDKSIARFVENGDISFYEDTGTTPKFFWDASAEGLALGQTSLLNNGTLTVKGDSKQAIVSTVSNNANSLFQGFSSSTTLAFQVTGSGNGYFAGNVGIGTTSPNQLLSLNSTASTARGISIDQSGAERVKLLYTNSSGAFDINNTTAGYTSFSNNGSERMRIDSSGNVLVGKTATASTTVGAEIRPEGRIFGTTDGQFPLLLNRKTSDGDIAVFRKDGTTVGTIGSRAGLVTYITSGGTYSGLDFGTDINPMKSGALSDGQVNLGASDQRFLNLHLSGNVHTGDGTAASPAYTFGDDTDTGIFSPAADTIAFSEGGTEAMRIDSSGNVGIGTTSPSSLLHVNGTARATTLRGGSGTNSAPGIAFINSTTSGFTNPSLATVGFVTGGNERARINSSGQLLVGTTSGGSYSAKIRASARIEGTGFVGTSNFSQFEQGGFMGGATITVKSWTGYSSSSQKLVSFQGSTGSERGTITMAGTSTQYNTTSDERAKENIQDAGDAGAKIDAIQIRQFDWKEDGVHQDFGVIAQELQSVAPEAVTQGFDEEDMWSVDYSKLVPTLIKEIQSLRNRVAQLENEE